MATTIPASKLSLRDIENKYNLQEVIDQEFFPEWANNLPDLSEMELQILDRVKANYKYLAKDLLLEDVVKMVVISPLLDWAGFYQPPFELKSEYEVSLSIEDKDKDTVVKGRIDLLAIREPIWVAVIEY